MLQSFIDFILYRFLMLVAPIQKLFQRVGRNETIITEEQVEAICSLIEPGDILGSFEYQRLTSRLIKGQFDHAAILADDGKVIEAVGDCWRSIAGRKINIGGVRAVGLREWLYKKDYVFVVRKTYTDESGHRDKTINLQAAAYCKTHIGKGYDYGFSRSNDLDYCSELPLISYQAYDRDFFSHITKQILPQQYLDAVGTNGMNLIINTKELK